MKIQLKELSGQRFGKWTVISYAGIRSHTKSKPAVWYVICDCGKKSTIAGTELRKKTNPSRSCGCSRLGTQPSRVGRYSRSQHHAWKGGRQVDKKGYIWLSISQIIDLYPDAQFLENTKRRKMLEHRAAMSHHIKRALFDDETVHHKNGDRSDNRIENLELRSGKHGPGQSIPDLVEWAKEILKRYT